MLRPEDRRVATEFQRRLSALIPVLDLRIFGSRARGDAAPDSDLDVFVEVEEVTPELVKRIFHLAWEVGFEMDRIISPFIATREQIERGPLGANPILRRIAEEGARP